MYKFHNNLKQVKLKKKTEFTFFFPYFIYQKTLLQIPKQKKQKLGEWISKIWYQFQDLHKSIRQNLEKN